MRHNLGSYGSSEAGLAVSSGREFQGLADLGGLGTEECDGIEILGRRWNGAGLGVVGNTSRPQWRCVWCGTTSHRGGMSISLLNFFSYNNKNC